MVNVPPGSVVSVTRIPPEERDGQRKKFLVGSLTIWVVRRSISLKRTRPKEPSRRERAADVLIAPCYELRWYGALDDFDRLVLRRRIDGLHVAKFGIRGRQYGDRANRRC